MTNLQALQSYPEFDGLSDNLLTKALLDNSITSDDDYTISDAKSMDLCAADIYLIMSTMPEYKEGTQSEKWNQKSCLTARCNLYKKWGETPPETSNRTFVINGKAVR